MDCLIDKINSIIDEELKGIDMEECENGVGWWETSKGAEFGLQRKKKLKEKIYSMIIEDCLKEG